MPERKISLVDDEGNLTTQAEGIIKSLSADPGTAPTVLVGSGVSIWEPTDLPSGQDFTQAAFSVLFGTVPPLSFPERTLLENIFGKEWSPKFAGMPFEHLMECCPSEDKGDTLIKRLYDSRRPNALHYALARGIKERKIYSIITTNYDCCIDEALTRTGVPFIKVVTNSQAKDALKNNNLPCYFKIHGSVEKGMERTAMFSLKHEGLLQADKSESREDMRRSKPTDANEPMSCKTLSGNSAW